MKEFEADGVVFSYPENWQLEREDEADGWTITINTPGSAFLMLRLDRSLPGTHEVAAAALEALRADYPALEAETALELIAGEMAVGHDVNFFSLDLPVTCWTRCLHAGPGTLLILCQVGDFELDRYEELLRATCASIHVEEE